MKKSLDTLIKEHKEELKILQLSYDKNMKAHMYGLAEKRLTQMELVNRFIRDLEQLKITYETHT